jgi:tetratricopeptide (TPR) repeat protein
MLSEGGRDMESSAMRTTLRVVVLLVAGLRLGTPGRALADESRNSGPAVQEDPQYTEGVKAVKRKDYSAAIRLFETVVAKDDRNADAYNWLAYSIRQNGDPGRAIAIYQKALTINPKHKGAHEYLGEAYLVLGDLARAREHLKILDKLCLFPCEEYTDLKKAVQAYEASGGRVKPTSQHTP